VIASDRNRPLPFVEQLADTRLNVAEGVILGNLHVSGIAEERIPAEIQPIFRAQIRRVGAKCLAHNGRRLGWATHKRRISVEGNTYQHRSAMSRRNLIGHLPRFYDGIRLPASLALQRRND
jgi:hypothetical protein